LVLFEKTKAFLEGYKKNLEFETSKWYQAMHDGCNTGYQDEENIDEYLWSTPFSEYYDETPKIQYQHIVKKELKELNDKGVYFLYCKFKIYEKTYEERLNEFLETYEDAFPVHFLEDELKIFFKPIYENAIYRRLEPKYRVDFSFTIDRCISYLAEEQARKIGYVITIERDGFGDVIRYEIESIKNIDKNLPENKNEITSELPKWFPIGLGFAKGEIQKKLKTISAREIAKEYNLVGSQNYISSTRIESIEDPKNIYSDLKKMKIVFVYCMENDIIVCDEFKKAYDNKLKELN
jgi:hypothetical protein